MPAGETCPGDARYTDAGHVAAGATAAGATNVLDALRFRLATPADARPIARASHALIEAGLGWHWTPERVARSIGCPDAVVLVAAARDRIAGFAIMRYGTDLAHLDLLAVRPRQRRAGLGRRLVKWVERSARVAGTTIVFLEVRECNAGARVFYRRLGYRELARLPRYYEGREPALRMGRDLAV